MRRAAALAGACLALSACWARGARLRVLEEILLAKDDNDPRLDGAFAGLSRREKALMRARYRALAPERRNERGTIVYLLGKDPADVEDWAFLRDVLGEPRCLSLADCSKEPAPGESGPGDEITLAYPPLVALRQARRALERRGECPDALSVIEAAKSSPAPAAARAASAP